jgi:hypothetical protein
MAFIKVEDVVINTTYIAAVRLAGKTSEGAEVVALLIAIPTVALFQPNTPSTNLYHYEWLEFVGSAAVALRDYFSSFNNVIDLLPNEETASSVVEFREAQNTHRPR